MVFEWCSADDATTCSTLEEPDRPSSSTLSDAPSTDGEMCDYGGGGGRASTPPPPEGGLYCEGSVPEESVTHPEGSAERASAEASHRGRSESRRHSAGHHRAEGGADF